MPFPSLRVQFVEPESHFRIRHQGRWRPLMSEAGVIRRSSMLCAVYAFARRFPCRMLLVRAYQSTTARTFSMPRTVNCLRSQFRHRA